MSFEHCPSHCQHHGGNSVAHNNLNQAIKRTPGTITEFAGSASGGKGATRDVSINGVPSTTSGNNFQGFATASYSDNKVTTVVAADIYGNKTTNRYQLTITASGTPTQLTYDLNGNLLTSVTGTTMDAYDWDGADQLVAITHRTSGQVIGTRTEFTYDGLGRRVRIVEKGCHRGRDQRKTLCVGWYGNSRGTRCLPTPEPSNFLPKG